MNPYQQIEEEVEYRVNAYRNFGEFCVQSTRDLNTTVRLRRKSVSREELAELSVNTLEGVLSSAWAEALGASRARFILATLENREQLDPVLVERALVFLKCYEYLATVLKGTYSRR